MKNKKFLIVGLLSLIGGLGFASATTTLISPENGFNLEGPSLDFYWGSDVGNISGMMLNITESGALYKSTTGFSTLYMTSVGGTSPDRIYSVTADDNGNMYAVGTFEGTGVFGDYTLVSSGGGDVFVAKLDSFGNVERVTKGGGLSNDYSEDVAIDSSGNVYYLGRFSLTGTFGSDVIGSFQSSDMFLSKLDSDGNYVWTKTMSGYNNGAGYDGGNSIKIDSQNNLYIAGGTLSNQFVMKLDSDGNTLRENIGIGDDSTIRALEIDLSGNIYIIGEFDGLTLGLDSINITGLDSIAARSVFVAKLDSTGTYLRAKSATGSYSTNHGNAIDVDNSGNVYIAGSFWGTFNFGSNSVTSAGREDVFVAKLDNDGNRLRASRGGSTSTSQPDRGEGILVSEDGSVFVVGRTYGNTSAFGSISVSPSENKTITFLGEISSTGEWISLAYPSGTSTNIGYSISEKDGEIYIGGEFYSNLTISGASISSAGSSDGYIWRINNPIKYKTSMNKLTDGNYERTVSVENTSGSLEVSNTGNFTVDVCAGITTYAESDCKALVRIYKHFYSEESESRRWNWLTNTTHRAGTQMTSNHVSQLRLQYSVMKNKNIPAGLFSGLTFMSTLDFSESDIESIESGAFIGTPALSNLYIGNNNVSSIEPGSFTGIPSLTYLGLYNNNLSGGINSGSFIGLEGNSLRRIDLNGNNISSVPEGTFQTLQNLDGVNLYDNNLTGISGIFSGLSSMTWFDVGTNPISKIPENYFENEGLTGLQYLYLYENQITGLKADMFSSLSNLEELDIYANPISEIETGTFNGLDNLLYLYMSNLKVKKLVPGMFYGLGSSLEDLELDDWGYDYLGLPAIIEEIATGTFANLTGLEYLSLAGNRIHTIPADIYGNNPLYLNSSRTWPINNCIDPSMVFTHSGVQAVDWQSSQKICPSIEYSTEEETTGPVTGTLVFRGGDANYRSGLNNTYTGITYVWTGNGEYAFILTGTLQVDGYEIKDGESSESIDIGGDIEYIHTNAYTVTGNVTWIIDEEPDTQAPEVSGVEEGGEYTSSATFTVTDNVGVNSVTLNGESLTERVSVTISEVDDYVLIAEDEAGNRTTVNFEVKERRSSGGGGGGGYYVIPEDDDEDEQGEQEQEREREESDKGTDEEKAKEIVEVVVGGGTRTVKVTREVKEAYEFAKEKKITTTKDIEEFDVEGKLIRMHLAKMISEFATEVMGKQEKTEGVEGCENFQDMEGETEDMQKYATMACKLGLMGRKADQITVSENFNPTREINRAQFGTILSRLLRGDTYATEDSIKYYEKHLLALNREGIMKVIEPEMRELRGWVILMLYRVRENREE